MNSHSRLILTNYHGTFSLYFLLLTYFYISSVFLLDSKYSWVLLFVLFDNLCLFFRALRSWSFIIILDMPRFKSIILFFVLYLLILNFVVLFLLLCLLSNVPRIPYFIFILFCIINYDYFDIVVIS